MESLAAAAAAAAGGGSSSAKKLLVFVANHQQNLRPTQLRTNNTCSAIPFCCQTETPRAASLNTPPIRFLGFLNNHLDFTSSSSSLLLPFHRKSIYPISSAPAPDSAASETGAGIEEIQTKDTTLFKSVHVKFQLQRECSFGQQFLVVGDDPILGLWDPSNAIPLNWSEGHVWTVEMDIPCDKVIKYKFILNRGDDTFLWQPGPDRLLKTWETRKTVTVCGDWDNSELQIIIEEGPVAGQFTESRDDLEELSVIGTLLQPGGEPEALTTTNGYAQPTTQPLADKPVSLVENMIEQHEEKSVEMDESAGVSFSPIPNKVVTLGVNDRQNIGKSESTGSFLVPKDEKDLDTSAPVPVLVPGLPPKPAADIEDESSSSKVDKQIGTASFVGSYKAQDANVPKINLKGEPDIHYQISEEETETLKPQISEEMDQPNHTGDEDNVLDSDIQWGRRTLQKFLTNLGLL